MASNSGAKTIYHEVRCDIHGTMSVNDQTRAKSVKVNAPGVGIPKGCPVVGCPNNPNSETDKRYE